MKLNPVNRPEFLGVMFDHSLSFTPHLNNVIKRCQRSLNMVKFLQGIWWGACPQTLLTFHKCFVRSIIDYASFVYYPTRKNLADKLEKIQYAAIRFALGYRNSTPTNILLAESKLPSICERSRFYATHI